MSQITRIGIDTSKAQQAKTINCSAFGMGPHFGTDLHSFRF